MNDKPSWSFEPKIVSTKRASQLLVPFDYGDLVNRITTEAVDINGHIEKATNQELSGCRRPIFRIKVRPDTFDLFFNSPWGYRGQYFVDENNGVEQNSRLVAALATKLIKCLQLDKNEQVMVNKSLMMKSAKIWIAEKGQINTADYNLKIGIHNPSWIKVAKEARKALDQYITPKPEEKLNAILGVRAPTGEVLDIKGAWISKDSLEHVDKYKQNRAKNICKYGFS
jgi:hypothetical protein